MSQDKSQPFRKVVSWERYYPMYAPKGGSAIEMHLDCGHVKRQKGSKPVPKRARCFSCAIGFVDVSTMISHRRGVVAYQEGRPLSANPYPDGRPDYRYWQDGWKDAELQCHNQKEK